MACTKETVKSSGLNFWSSEAADGPAPVVDIIAVQGLGADPFYTWVKKVPAPDADRSKRFRDRAPFRKCKKARGKGGEDGSTEVMWLRDVLVPLFKDARIATYSYESDWRDPNVKTDLYKCANQFLNALYQHRDHASERLRPIVLIGHSLGGLVIQQALVIAVHEQVFADLCLSVAGILFLGAPLQGSNAAIFGEWLAQLLGRDSTLLQALRKDSPGLHALSRAFWGSYADRDSICFYEDREADYGLLKTQVVSPQSASLVGKRMMSLNTDHSGLNKFSGKDDKNFQLVLPEIQRMVKDGPSIVAKRYRAKEVGATSHGNVAWTVPRTVNSLFTGRTELLLRIQTVLRGDTTSLSKQRRFVITGLGGQGKSEICLKVASQMQEEFWGVFWVDVGKEASTIKSDFIDIAKWLGHSVESVCDALRVLTTTKQTWLLILDNADDPNFDYQAYFPSGTHGAVLMTSRVSGCKQYSPDANEALEGLEEEGSKELLLKAADIPEELWLSHNNPAKEVVQLLGSHTLALIQAGAYIARGHCQLNQYPQVYEQERKQLLEFKPKQAKSRYCDVYATFEASAKMLEKFGSEAAKDALSLLAILSMLDSAVLPLQIFQSAWDGSKIDTMSRSHVLQLPGFLVAEGKEWNPYRLNEASSELVSLSLVTRQDPNGLVGLSMHPLTHAWAKDRQDSKQQEVAWIAAGCVLAFSRTNSTMWQTQERRLLPHIQSYLDIKIIKALLFRSKAIVAPILFRCGWALLDMRQDSRLSHLLEDMFTELKKNPEEPPEEPLPLYDLQARNFLNIRENKKAVALLEQVVTKLPEDHPDRLGSQHALALAYRASGQVEKAIPLLEQVATKLPEDHPDRLASQHELARAYRVNGQVEEAVALLKEVVEIRGKLAADHPDRLGSQHELALAYQANGQVEEAVALLKEVVKIRGTMLAADHPDRLASQHALARAKGQVKEAVALLQQVVAMLAADHPVIGTTNSWVGTVRFSQSDEWYHQYGQQDIRAMLDTVNALEDMFTELKKNPEEPSKESLPLYDLQARRLVEYWEDQEGGRAARAVSQDRKGRR